MEGGNDIVEVESILEGIPFGCILIKKSGKVRYVNRFAANMLEKVEKYFDKKIDDWKGCSIELLHKNFEKWGNSFNEAMLGNKKIMIDAERISLHFEIRRADFCKKIDSFLIVVESVEKNVKSDNDDNFSTKSLMECMEELQKIYFGTEGLSRKFKEVHIASKDIGVGVSTVNSHIKEVDGNVNKLEKNSGETLKIVDNMMSLAKNFKNAVPGLEESSASNRNITKLLSSLAQQSNLLALNATIEAARAGESGKSFAVVAQEIKNISQQIEQISEDVGKAMGCAHGNGKDVIELVEKIILEGHKLKGDVDKQESTLKDISHLTKKSVENMEQMDKNIVHTSRCIDEADDEMTNAQKIIQKLKSGMSKLW